MFFRSDGKIVVLKEIDSDVEMHRYVKHRIRYPRKEQKRLGAKKDAPNTENSAAESEKGDKIDKPRFALRKRSHKRAQPDEENSSPNTEVQVSSLYIILQNNCYLFYYIHISQFFRINDVYIYAKIIVFKSLIFDLYLCSK